MDEHPEEGGYLIPEWVDVQEDKPGRRAAIWRWLTRGVRCIRYRVEGLAISLRVLEIELQRRGRSIKRVNFMAQLLAARDQAQGKTPHA